MTLYQKILMAYIFWKHPFITRTTLKAEEIRLAQIESLAYDYRPPLSS